MKIKVTSACALLLWFSMSTADRGSIVSVLQPYVDKHELAGAVTLVVSKERVLSLESIGYADVAAKKPMKDDAIFWIASMSKPITAFALMKARSVWTIRCRNTCRSSRRASWR